MMMEVFSESVQKSMLITLLEVFPDAMPLRELIGAVPTRELRYSYVYLSDHGRIALVKQNPEADRTVRITAAGIDYLRSL